MENMMNGFNFNTAAKDKSIVTFCVSLEGLNRFYLVGLYRIIIETYLKHDII